MEFRIQHVLQLFLFLLLQTLKFQLSTKSYALSPRADILTEFL